MHWEFSRHLDRDSFITITAIVIGYLPQILLVAPLGDRVIWEDGLRQQIEHES